MIPVLRLLCAVWGAALHESKESQDKPSPCFPDLMEAHGMGSNDFSHEQRGCLPRGWRDIGGQRSQLDGPLCCFSARGLGSGQAALRT